MHGRRIRAHGFTLVELLAVLAVVALAGSAVLLTQPDDGQQLLREGERLAARLQHAQEEAILGTRAIEVVAAAEGYRFNRQHFADWEPLRERPFGDIAWEQGTTPRLSRQLPQVRFDFDPTGIAEPAELVLQRGDASVRVAVDAAGQVRLDALRD
jgi:general secretion pathway protein H